MTTTMMTRMEQMYVSGHPQQGAPGCPARSVFVPEQLSDM